MSGSEQADDGRNRRNAADEIEEREAALLPMPYHHVFTLPARSPTSPQNKAVAYDLFLRPRPILVAGWPNYHTNVHCRVRRRDVMVVHRRKLLRVAGATAAVAV